MATTRKNVVSAAKRFMCMVGLIRRKMGIGCAREIGSSQEVKVNGIRANLTSSSKHMKPYNALIDGFLEKSASKWKEMILAGGLSGAARDKLLKKYVDPERMIAGLNKETDNLFKKYNIDTKTTSYTDKDRYIRKYKLPQGLIDPYVTAVYTDNRRGILLPKGFIYNHFPAFLSGNPFSIKYRSARAVPNRYIDAIAKRHEPDEIRVGGKSGYKQKWIPNKYVKHFSPEVVARESEHVAIAPPASNRIPDEAAGENPVMPLEAGG